MALQTFFKTTKILSFILAFAGMFFISGELKAKKNESVSQAQILSRLMKLPEKERLAVMVYAEHTSNQYLAAIANNNRKQLGSIDEVEEIRLAVQKNKTFQKLQEDAVPGKFGTYYTDWIKTLSGYLDGSVTFFQFRDAQKSNDKKLEKILKGDFTAEEAKKTAQKHAKLIQEVGSSFYRPAIEAVYKEQLDDLRNFANSGNTACMPVDKKGKDCGLNKTLKGHITKLNKIIEGGQGRIYRTLRIGDKIVLYVVMQKTKKELKAAVAKVLKKHPTALEATYTIMTMRSLCADKNFTSIMKKTKWTGQIVLHSRDLLPIFNLRFKDCGDINKFAGKVDPKSAK